MISVSFPSAPLAAAEVRWVARAAEQAGPRIAICCGEARSE